VATHVAVGQFISTAIPVPLLTLADDRKRQVRAKVDERDLAKVCLAQRAVVTSDAFPGVEVAAISEQMGAEVTHRARLHADRAETGARDVLLSLRDSASNWPLGLSVMVKFVACPKR